MGVDASYLYGYGAEISDIEWDSEYLKEKHKNELNCRVDARYDWKPTWGEFIEIIGNVLEDDEEEDPYEILVETLYDVDHLIDVDQVDEETYITFNHKHIAKLYPDTKLSELDDVAKLYAKELGIKNVDKIQWIEFGYFD